MCSNCRTCKAVVQSEPSRVQLPKWWHPKPSSPSEQQIPVQSTTTIAVTCTWQAAWFKYTLSRKWESRSKAASRKHLTVTLLVLKGFSRPFLQYRPDLYGPFTYPVAIASFKLYHLVWCIVSNEAHDAPCIRVQGVESNCSPSTQNLVKCRSLLDDTSQLEHLVFQIKNVGLQSRT